MLIRALTYDNETRIRRNQRTSVPCERLHCQHKPTNPPSPYLKMAPVPPAPDPTRQRTEPTSKNHLARNRSGGAPPPEGPAPLRGAAPPGLQCPNCPKGPDNNEKSRALLTDWAPRRTGRHGLPNSSDQRGAPSSHGRQPPPLEAPHPVPGPGPFRARRAITPSLIPPTLSETRGPRSPKATHALTGTPEGAPHNMIRIGPRRRPPPPTEPSRRCDHTSTQPTAPKTRRVAGQPRGQAPSTSPTNPGALTTSAATPPSTLPTPRGPVPRLA
uniref:Uncharacterized protein n=1 Tax=Knipowitschia caucasica TaxID=637954 RepID=A0AAV2LJM1_KNICA